MGARAARWQLASAQFLARDVSLLRVSGHLLPWHLVPYHLPAHARPHVHGAGRRPGWMCNGQRLGGHVGGDRLGGDGLGPFDAALPLPVVDTLRRRITRSDLAARRRLAPEL